MTPLITAAFAAVPREDWSDGKPLRIAQGAAVALRGPWPPWDACGDLGRDLNVEPEGPPIRRGPGAGDEVRDREALLIALRAEGLAWPIIARHVGYASYQGAQVAHARALRRKESRDAAP